MSAEALCLRSNAETIAGTASRVSSKWGVSSFSSGSISEVEWEGFDDEEVVSGSVEGSESDLGAKSL